MPQRLAKSLITLAQFYTTLLLMVWIALFAPMLCQYHGVMLHSHARSPCADFDQNPSQNNYQHSATSRVTLVMTMLLAALPNASMLSQPALTQTRAIESFRFPSQRREPPLRQPPRW